MITTRMTELLGIEHPIMMGAMAWITKARLVAAVSNAGATGVLAAGGRSPDWVREQIRATKALTEKPFGINLPLAMTPQVEDLVETIVAEGIAFVTLGAGDPRPLIPRFHAAGILVICIVPNTKLATRIEAAGADLLIVEGMESGGTVGRLSTLALMSNVIPEVRAPVIAAGGIVDGRGLAAALMMGSVGAQLGSRFLLAAECEIHPDNQQQIIQAADTDSVVTGWSRGTGSRGLRSAFADQYLAMEISGVPTDELRRFATGASRRVAESGIGPDGMNGIVQVGESLGPLKKVQPAADIVAEIIADAEVRLLDAPKFVRPQEH